MKKKNVLERVYVFFTYKIFVAATSRVRYVKYARSLNSYHCFNSNKASM